MSLGGFVFAGPEGASFWDKGWGGYLRIPSRSSRGLDGGWEKRDTGDPSALASSPPGEARRASLPFLPSPLPISLSPSPPLPCRADL